MKYFRSNMANAASGLLTPDENKKLWEIIQYI